MAHCGFCLGHRYNKQRRSCLNEAASWDDDSVCSSSLTAHDDVFDDGVPFCNTDRGKEDDVLSPVSYWILSGKYKWDSTKHHHQSPTLTPKRKTHSLDGSYTTGTRSVSSQPLSTSHQRRRKSTTREDDLLLHFDDQPFSKKIKSMQSNEDVYESNTYRNGSVADAQQRLTDILLRRLHFHRRKLSECSDTVCKEEEDMPGLNSNRESQYASPMPLSGNSFKQFQVHDEQKRGDCSCLTFEKHFMKVAESAYKNIRRPNRSPQAFQRFRQELCQTNDAMKDSLNILIHMKEFCDHNHHRT